MPNGDVFTGIFEDIHKVEGKQVYSSDGAVYEGQWKRMGDYYGEDVWHGVGRHPALFCASILPNRRVARPLFLGASQSPGPGVPVLQTLC